MLSPQVTPAAPEPPGARESSPGAALDPGPRAARRIRPPAAGGPSRSV